MAACFVLSDHVHGIRRVAAARFFLRNQTATNMFHQDFYPTPQAVIKRMIEGLNLKGKVVLDPSAGSGNILKHVLWGRTIYGGPSQLLAIEVTPELQAILRAEKDIKLIGDDFLKFSGNIWVDVILMNPPFSQVEKHLRRAWEMLRSGDLVCVIPSTMVWNPTQAESALIQELKEAGADFEPIGQAFTTAERKTNVDVMIVRAKKSAENLMNFGNLRTTNQAEQFSFKEQEAGQIMQTDALPRLADAYTAAISGFGDVLRATNALITVLNVLPPDKKWHSVIAKAIEGGTGAAAFNDFAFEVQGYVWDALFNKTNLAGMLTSKVRDEFTQLRQKAGGIDLTPENIQAVFEMLFDNLDNTLQDCLEQAFDRMTKHYDSNRLGLPGFKTNDAWMVKDKLILPGMIEYKSYGGDSAWMNVNYHREDWCQDVDKALCLLSGKKYEDICKRTKQPGAYSEDRYSAKTIYDSINRACVDYLAGNAGEAESEFFRVKAHKSGTVHLWWLDKELLETFNAKVCAARNWLPGDYGKSYRRKDKKTEEYIKK